MENNLDLTFSNDEIETVYATLNLEIDEIADSDKALVNAVIKATAWKIQKWLIRERFEDIYPDWKLLGILEDKYGSVD